MLPHHQVREILASPATVSDKIRNLNAAGYPRAEIAKLVGRRYQHVRNVLEGDKLKTRTAEQPASPQARAVEESPNASIEDRGAGLYRLELGEDGRVALPDAALLAMGVRTGDALIAQFNGSQLTLMSGRESVRRARELVQSLIPRGVNLSDELERDRRNEAKGD